MRKLRLGLKKLLKVTQLDSVYVNLNLVYEVKLKTIKPLKTYTFHKYVKM